MVLVVGATGELGFRVAKRLRERGTQVRALVRPGSDAAPLEAIGVDVVRGDLSDSRSLQVATRDMRTAVTTATAISRALGGDSSATIAGVDVRGNANLVDAAERAGVERFVFVSFPMSALLERSPLGAAK